MSPCLLHAGQLVPHKLFALQATSWGQKLMCARVYAVGAIVGGVAGGLAVYLITTITLGLILRHKRKKLRQVAAQHAPETKALASGHMLETGARPEVGATPATVQVQPRAQ